jgi:hypothetical protein
MAAILLPILLGRDSDLLTLIPNRHCRYENLDRREDKKIVLFQAK